MRGAAGLINVRNFRSRLAFGFLILCACCSALKQSALQGHSQMSASNQEEHNLFEDSFLPQNFQAPMPLK